MYGEMPESNDYAGYYKLENNYVDSSKNGRDLSVRGSVGFTEGKFGEYGIKSLGYFSGLYCDDNFGVGTNSNVTLSFWFKLPVVNPYECNFISVGVIKSSGGLLYGVDYNLIADPNVTIHFYRHRWGVERINSNIVGIITNDVWHHSLLIWKITDISTNSGELYGYLDGVKSPVVETSGTSNVNPGWVNRLAIGTYNDFSGDSTNVCVDEVIVDNRAWSEGEVRRYYSMCKGKCSPYEIASV